VTEYKNHIKSFESRP